MVIMPDHLHCIWTLPHGDHDFSTIRIRSSMAWHSLPASGSTAHSDCSSRLDSIPVIGVMTSRRK
jgi:hypothetical protein